MDAASIALDRPTNRTVTGPRFRKEGPDVVVEYDYQHDDGTVEWERVVFREVLAFEYREASCCRADDITGAREVRCAVRSERLSEVLGRWQEAVGWQEWQQKQGGAGRFKHFSLYFDDAACVDVIAASCQISRAS